MDLRLSPSELAKIFMDEFTIGDRSLGCAADFIRMKLRESSFIKRIFPEVLVDNKKWFSKK